MTNKFIKIFTIILTVFIINFVGINDVKAKEYYNCLYEAVLTNIDKDNIATIVTTDITYNGLWRNGWSIIPGACSGCRFVPDIQQASGTIQSFCLIPTDDGINLGFKLKEPITNIKNANNIEQKIFVTNREILNSTEVLESLIDENNNYIKMYVDYADGFDLKLKKSNKEEYSDYLKDQYKNMDLGTNQDLFHPYAIGDLSSTSEPTRYVTANDDDACGYNGCSAVKIPKLHDTKSKLASYLLKSQEIIFIKNTVAEKYPNDRYNKFKKELNDRGKGDLLENFPIDGSDNNSITHNSLYYDNTKDKWYAYMMNDISDPKAADKRRKEYFSKWYENINRYIFEKDLSLFKQYFVYLYDGQPSIMPEEEYNIYLSIINNMLEYEDAENQEDCYETDFCISAICNNQCSGTQHDVCIRQDPYIKCNNAYKNCKQLLNVNSNTFDSCMIGYLDEDTYQSIKDKREKIKEDIEKQKDDAIDDMISNLLSIPSPSFKGIHINKKGYKVNCSEVDFLHKFYVALRILAPILVILFGSLDYVKSVLGADEKKILEARKKLPKRIILLILFILIPIIISILVDAFMTGDNTSLMTCVIKGA